MNNQLPHAHLDRQAPAPGQVAYDPASGRTDVLQAVYSAAELCFDHQVTGTRVAFLRSARGGVEWLADAATLQSPAAENRAT
ncbi:hypothetical protein [Streptomyces sp. ME19-01-6]|uniref:hypothetical protein n=1 Tax=Streptomyces sp. ME19-01-6 TaxID=3028686 RepID=UPI0029A8914D|nr:hypothetical protein [Streptomyces sp. ME19-01-6]MDX3231073.1 hypothetical protein [Streptomyces sp. ME19-01-6]